MRKSSVQVLATVLVASLAATPTAGAQASSSSSPTVAAPVQTGLSSVDAAATASSGSSLSSDVALSSVPALLGAILAEGALGSSMFGLAGEGPTSSGSSHVNRTFPPALGEDGSGARLRSVEHVTGDLYRFQVWSPSMNKVISNEILLPGDVDDTAPRPTFYLMMGADGANVGHA